jgi:hypothetical protein
LENAKRPKLLSNNQSGITYIGEEREPKGPG